MASRLANLVVSYIVGGVNEQNSNVNSFRVDDWTTERAIIASNVTKIKMYTEIKDKIR